MKSRFIFPSIALAFISIMSIYFIVNPSYQKSIEAKYYYEMGNYKEAYSLASEAFGIDVYNRMASTIMAQSKTSLKYVKYINQAKDYLAIINVIASKDTVSDADRAKIRIMSEIVTDSYTKLAPSIITDKILVKEAARYNDDFGKLLEKVPR